MLLSSFLSSIRKSAWITLLALTCTPITAHESHEHHTRVASKPPRLSRVLLIGDSISMGYHGAVVEGLKGVAEVHRPKQNCGPTIRGLENLDKWLGDGKWDLIHFNFGLHDLRYMDFEEDGQKVRRHQVPIDQYAKNLTTLTERLKNTGATVIWCSTTPVPEGAANRVPGDEVKYNAAAEEVVARVIGKGFVVNDLHAFALKRRDKIQRPANVHYTKRGSRVLGQQVVEMIKENLPKRDTPPTAKGVVYEDKNNNGEFDATDAPMPGVRVSNGRQIVKTDNSGRYELPVTDDTILFVVKPSGYRTPISKEMLPRFYYIHKPKGSPKNFKYAGVAPTGPLPASVDFPLYKQDEPKRFKAIMFGDPQPVDQKEVDFVAHDVVEDLIGTDASFGVTLGDITFDDLDLFKSQNRAIAVLGIPWYNVIGNHDINYEAKHDKQSDETFEQVYGPTYYSFDYGAVHFLVLDDIEWIVNDAGQGGYRGGLGEDQLAFVERDLELIPDDQLVVLMMHIPVTKIVTPQRRKLYSLIENRPFCMSISGHEHYHEHRFLTKKDGWNGPKPHHHVVNVTVSGNWWGGIPDERGIPHATMGDGAPNGYTIMTFEGHEYQLAFRAAGRPASYQMNIDTPEEIATSDSPDVVVNVFNGSEKSTVEMTIDSGEQWTRLEHTVMRDPDHKRMGELETKLGQALAAQNGGKQTDFRPDNRDLVSRHIWLGKLPAGLEPGTHCIRVRSKDMHGNVHWGYRTFRVVE